MTSVPADAISADSTRNVPPQTAGGTASGAPAANQSASTGAIGLGDGGPTNTSPKSVGAGTFSNPAASAAGSLGSSVALMTAHRASQSTGGAPVAGRAGPGTLALHALFPPPMAASDAVLLKDPIVAILAGAYDRGPSGALDASGVTAARSAAVSSAGQPAAVGPAHRGWQSANSTAPASSAPEPEIAIPPPPGGRRGPQGGGAASSGGGGAPPSLIVMTGFALITASCCWFITAISPHFRCPEARCLERPG
jgi:hypothetical protein